MSATWKEHDKGDRKKLPRGYATVIPSGKLYLNRYISQERLDGAEGLRQFTHDSEPYVLLIPSVDNSNQYKLRRDKRLIAITGVLRDVGKELPEHTPVRVPVEWDKEAGGIVVDCSDLPDYDPNEGDEP